MGTLPPAGIFPRCSRLCFGGLPLSSLLQLRGPGLASLPGSSSSSPYSFLLSIPPGYWERNFHEYFEGVAGLYAALGCAGAAWLAVKLAVRALTTTTLSVGEFQWEYKETIAGLSLIPTCYRQGTTEDLDISRDGDKIVLITGLTKVDFGRQNVGALSDKELNWVVDSVQIYQRQITAIYRATR